MSSNTAETRNSAESSNNGVEEGRKQRRITIITGNERKRKDIARHIGDQIEYEFVEMEIEEIQGTAQEIIRKKLEEAHKIAKGPVIVEDYSLYIDVLKGFPGPYVKFLLVNGELGEIVKNLRPLGEITCRSECVYGYIDENNKAHIFSADTKGVLVPAESETRGNWGIDSCLIQEGTTKPYRYLTEEEQDRVSIRKRTIEKLLKHIKNSVSSAN